jgi:hypothetical protein
MLIRLSVNANNISGVNNYTFTSVYTLSGQSFYKLKMIDLDGSYMYSNVIVLKNDLKERLTVSNNLISDNKLNFQLSGLLVGNYQLQLINMNGQLLSSKSLSVNTDSFEDQLLLNKALSKGCYLVRLIGNKVSETKEIIIQ